MPGGALFGVLFFASLVLAGITSLISLVQVVAAASSKINLIEPTQSRPNYRCSSMIVSVAPFSTHTGLFTLDVVDAFINEIGVVTSAIIMCVFASVGVGKLPELRKHLNAVSQFLQANGG